MVFVGMARPPSAWGTPASLHDSTAGGVVTPTGSMHGGMDSLGSGPEDQGFEGGRHADFGAGQQLLERLELGDRKQPDFPGTEDRQLLALPGPEGRAPAGGTGPKFQASFR